MAKRKRTSAGSGRKPTGHNKKKWCQRLSLDVVAYLQTQPSQATAVEEAVRASEGYLRWRFGESLVTVPDHVALPPEGD